MGGVQGCASGGAEQDLALAVVGREEGVMGGPTERGVWVVESPEELRGLLTDTSIASRLSRRVRWGQQVVVVVGQGTQPTGGYWVRVTGVELGERRGKPWLTVRYMANRPGPGDIVTQALTQPYSAVVVDGVSGAGGVGGVTGQPDAVEGLVR